jgi:carbamoyl-phosphate synthase large subunit
MSIVKTHHIDLIIPTVDLDLKILSKSQTSLQAMDCRVLISAPPVVDICRDKRKTYRFLVKHGFNTPITASVHSVLTGKVNISAWPLLIKPWDGSAGRDHRIARNRQELQFFSKRIRHPVCQQWIQGKEYTCDVYVDRHMKVRCVVPRRRMEVRAGEVSKARIEKNPSMIDGVTRLVQTLKAGPGVITVQLIVTNRKELMFIEINPRFGGGVPLSIQAGAHFPKWVLRELLGRPLKIQQEGFQDGLVMLRYDSEVWIQP